MKRTALDTDVRPPDTPQGKPHLAGTRANTADAPTESEFAGLLRQQENLRAFVESISSELEFRPLLDLTLEHACDLTCADAGTLAVVDSRHDVIRVESVWGAPAAHVGQEYGPAEGLPGRVLESSESVLVERRGEADTTPVPAAPGTDARAGGTGAGDSSALAVPVSWQGELFGCIEVIRFPGQDGEVIPFDERDARTLEAFARHAAIAMENARRYLREQERGERLELIAKIGNLLTANFELNDMLQRAADAIHDLLGYASIGIGLYEAADPPVLAISATSGQRTYRFAKPFRLPITEGVMGACARERRPILVDDVTEDARYVTPPNMDPPEVTGIRCQLCLPILRGNQILGVLNVESDEPFDDEDPASLQTVADQLAVAIEAARLYQAGQELAALQERQRLSRELHDSVTQHLFGTVMLAESLGEVWHADPDRGAKRTARLLELSRAALAEMRALLRELRDSELPGAGAGGIAFGLQRVRAHGLVPALEGFGEEMSARGLPVTLDAAGYAPQSQAREEALYRIAQEALNNAFKHSRASRCEVRLDAADGSVRLLVRDDGVGLPGSERAGPSEGGRTLGIASMRERAQALGGTLAIRPGPDGGVEVEASVPAG